MEEMKDIFTKYGEQKCPGEKKVGKMLEKL